MKTHRVRTTVLAAGALAVALSGMACGERNRAEDERDTAASGREANDNRSVTLSGCLQQGDGTDYILTQANGPSAAVGTSGSPGNAAGVEQRQHAEAARSYRLSGDNDEFRDLVGHEVRVTGTLEDEGDLNKDSGRTADRGAAGTSGDRPEANRGEDDRDRREINERDLARVDVASIESVAKTCGSSNQK